MTMKSCLVTWGIVLSCAFSNVAAQTVSQGSLERNTRSRVDAKTSEQDTTKHLTIPALMHEINKPEFIELLQFLSDEGLLDVTMNHMRSSKDTADMRTYIESGTYDVLDSAQKQSLNEYAALCFQMMRLLQKEKRLEKRRSFE